MPKDDLVYVAHILDVARKAWVAHLLWRLSI